MISLYILTVRVKFFACKKVGGSKSLVKLGSGWANFKNNLEERPTVKSCSTSFFHRKALKLNEYQKISFGLSYCWFLVSYVIYIYIRYGQQVSYGFLIEI